MSADILGIIPARGGSKGVLRKNIRPLAGEPLLHYTVEAANMSSMLGRVVVSTEDGEIAGLAKDWGCEVLNRPVELSQDETPMLPVIQHVLEVLVREEDYRPEITVILQPTAPLRRAEHIDGCLHLMMNTGAASVVSVSVVPAHNHPDWQFIINPEGELGTFSGRSLDQILTRRQDLKRTFTRNGALYAIRTAMFQNSGSLYPEPCVAYVMESEDSINIDSEEDFWLAEQYLLRRKGNT